MKNFQHIITTAVCVTGISGFVIGANPLLSSAADPQFKEGLWEITTNIQMEGMPEMPKLPPGVQLPPGMSMSSQGNTMQVTMKQCITKDHMIPEDEESKKAMKENRCKILHQEQRGNTVKWSMVCEEDGMKMKSDGTATYTGDVMESKIVSTTQAPGEPPTKQIMTAKGRYLGPCPK